VLTKPDLANTGSKSTA